MQDGIHIARMIHELYSGQRGLGQIPVNIFVDSQALCDSIFSTKQIDDKSIQHVIASFKQCLEDGEIRNFEWVCTKLMYADLLTKPGVKPDLMMEAMQAGIIRRQN